MRILLVHPNFPSQLRALAFSLSRNKSNEVVFLTNQVNGDIPGVRKLMYKPKRDPSPQTHNYLREFERAVLHGQAACEVAIQAKKQGFVPDIIFGHAGWGTTLYLKDVFPDTPVALNFEWFYHARGSDCDFDPSEKLSIDDEARIRTKNATLLADLAACDGGVCATRFQYDQFPEHLRSNLIVGHEGIDTNFFKPNPGGKLVLANGKLDLSGVDKIVTYATRGMEQYRGFTQFIEAAHILQQKRPNVHVVIGGEDRVAYGNKAPDGKSYKQIMLEKFPLDPSRTHFVGSLPYTEYLKLLQCTTAHVYLTRPFVLSWSLLEAMSCGALVVASDTEPVREVMKDGINGVIVDFFRPDRLAEALDKACEDPRGYDQIREKARATVIAQYELSSCLNHRLRWLSGLMESRRIRRVFTP
jgi:glycosyltransferase involved in cell wall biosynthesis